MSRGLSNPEILRLGEAALTKRGAIVAKVGFIWTAHNDDGYPENIPMPPLRSNRKPLFSVYLYNERGDCIEDYSNDALPEDLRCLLEPMIDLLAAESQVDYKDYWNEGFVIWGCDAYTAGWDQPVATGWGLYYQQCVMDYNEPTGDISDSQFRASGGEDWEDWFGPFGHPGAEESFEEWVDGWFGATTTAPYAKWSKKKKWNKK